MNGFTQAGKYLWKCDTRGTKVESGMVRIAEHWNNCTGKGFKEALMEAAGENELTLEKVKDIRLHEEMEYNTLFKNESAKIKRTV